GRVLLPRPPGGIPAGRQRLHRPHRGPGQAARLSRLVHRAAGAFPTWVMVLGFKDKQVYPGGRKSKQPAGVDERWIRFVPAPLCEPPETKRQGEQTAVWSAPIYRSFGIFLLAWGSGSGTARAGCHTKQYQSSDESEHSKPLDTKPRPTAAGCPTWPV